MTTKTLQEANDLTAKISEITRFQQEPGETSMIRHYSSTGRRRSITLNGDVLKRIDKILDAEVSRLTDKLRAL